MDKTVFLPPGEPGGAVSPMMLGEVILLWSDAWGSLQVDLDLDSVGMAGLMRGLVFRVGSGINPHFWHILFFFPKGKGSLYIQDF